MRMRSCPQCGADNSVKRTTCYQCQSGLPATSEPPPRNNAPASRWDALETGRRRQPDGQTAPAPPPPAAGTEDSVHRRLTPAGAMEGESPPSQARREKRAYRPMRRSSLKHVRQMGIFFRELYTLAGSGIALAAAFREMTRRAPRPLQPVAREMGETAEEGKPISAVMQKYQTLFYPWHVGVVRAAEIGGFLPEAFEQIAHAYEEEWETRSAFRLRLFFYGIFGVPSVLFALPLMLTVAQPIPADGWTPGTVIENILHFARTVSLPIAVGLGALVLVWQMLQTTTWFQGVQQRIVFRLPVVGRIARAAALDRYLATLGLMLRGGLPIAAAAEEAALAAGNVVLTPKLLEFVPALREGTALSGLLAQTREFDADTLNMAATGEVTGSLPDMLARAADYYREDSAAKRKMALKIGGVAFGVVWMIILGALAFLALQNYYNFVFRVEEWVTGEDLEGINW
jgi:type II secretory pathway component PulF